MLSRDDQKGIILRAVAQGNDARDHSSFGNRSEELVKDNLHHFGLNEDRVSIGEFNRIVEKVDRIQDILDR